MEEEGLVTPDSAVWRKAGRMFVRVSSGQSAFGAVLVCVGSSLLSREGTTMEEGWRIPRLAQHVDASDSFAPNRTNFRPVSVQSELV